MTSTTSRSWLWVGIPLIFILLALGWWMFPKPIVPLGASVVLPDGTKVRLQAVTVGTVHTLGRDWSRLLKILPPGISGFIQTRFRLSSRTIRTPEESLVAWLDYQVPTNRVRINPNSWVVMLADGAGEIGGEQEHLSFLGFASVSSTEARFPIWPRRSSSLELVFIDTSDYENQKIVGRLPFHNPSLSSAAEEWEEWEEESLPARKSLDDLDVEVQSFFVGIGNRTSQRSDRTGGSFIAVSPAKEGERKQALVSFTVSSNGSRDDRWKVAEVWMADASGNRKKATSWSGGEEGWVTFSPVLWPEESVWELELGLKRKTQFREEDLAVFSEVSLPKVGETNEYSLTQELHGIELALKSFIRKTNNTASSWSSRDVSQLRFEHSVLEKGWAVDFVSLEVEGSSEKISSSSQGWSGSHYEIAFRIIPDSSQTATVTMAVQPIHRFRFKVEPKWVQGTNEITIRQ